MEHVKHHNVRQINNDKVRQLLKTARGQIEGVLKMYEGDRYCLDISNQVISLISILHNANALILNDHINSCVVEAIEKQNGQEKIDEITELLMKVLK